MGIYLPSPVSPGASAGERAADPEGSRPSTTETPADGKPDPLPGTLARTFNLGPCICGLQVTVAGSMSSRRTKMMGMPDQVEPFIRAGGVVLLMGWKKQGHRWQWAAERFTIGPEGLEVGPRTAWMTPPRTGGGRGG